MTERNTHTGDQRNRHFKFSLGPNQRPLSKRLTEDQFSNRDTYRSTQFLFNNVTVDPFSDSSYIPTFSRNENDEDFNGKLSKYLHLLTL